MHRYQKDTFKRLGIFCLEKRGFGEVRMEEGGVSVALQISDVNHRVTQRENFFHGPRWEEKKKSVGGSGRDSVH